MSDDARLRCDSCGEDGTARRWPDALRPLCPACHAAIVGTPSVPLPAPTRIPSRDTLDLLPTPDLVAALERRFDCLVFAGTIALAASPTMRQEQRVVRVKGHDLLQVGLVQLLAGHVQPQPLPAVSPARGGEGVD